MADYQALSSRFHKEVKFTSAGVIEPIDGTRIYGERSLVVAVENVQGTNEILVQGKMNGANDWILISEIVGAVEFNATRQHVIDISKYDLIRFEVNRYVPKANSIPKLIASGFYADGDTNSKLEALIALQNKYFLQLNSNVEMLRHSIERIETQLAIITGLDINGD